MYLFNLALKCHHDRVFAHAGGLTYRILLGFFPFIVFLMALLGYLDLDEAAILSGLYGVFPQDISVLVAGFIYELSETRSGGILSTALFFSVYNTTNGFRFIAFSLNAAHGVDAQRGFVKQVLLSFVLMLLFSASLLVMLVLLVFGRQMFEFVFPWMGGVAITLASGAGALVILIFTTMLIYRLACVKKLPTRHVLPGAVLTVVGWVLASAFFGFITTNFTQYSAVYGSIAGVFFLILWLNVISVVLLVGNEANALVGDYF